MHQFITLATNYILMSFWERLRAFFGLRPKKKAVLKDPAGKEVSPATASEKQPLAKRKVTTTMLNSVTFSSDMEKLYLIDNGRAISFDLKSPGGILIGTLGDQLVVATGKDSGEATEQPTSGDTAGGGAELEGGGTANPIARRPIRTELKFPVAKDKQWTTVFNEGGGILAIIGVTDITSGIAQPEPATTNGTLFNIGKRPVIIRRKGDIILISQLRD